MTGIELLEKEIELLDKLLWARARTLSAQRIPYKLDNEYIEKDKEYDEKVALLERLKKQRND